MRTTAKHHTGILLHRSQFVQTLVTMLEGPAVRDRERERERERERQRAGRDRDTEREKKKKKKKKKYSDQRSE